MTAAAKDYVVPSGDGELLAEPPVMEWASLAAHNSRAAEGWDVQLLGGPLVGLREGARRGALQTAVEYSAWLGLRTPPAAGEGLLLVTGHQPTLFHPGIWVKHLLIDSVARRAGALALDLVVDSDAASELCPPTPSLDEEGILSAEEMCLVDASRAGEQAPFEAVDAPSLMEIEAWLAALEGRLATLPDPYAVRNLKAFGAVLREGAPDGASVGDLLVAGRRRYEAPIGTTYLELPVSRLAASREFRLFVLDACSRAERFREVYNAALAAYRRERGLRGTANPFPDLGHEGARLELPFWVMTSDGRRETLWVERAAEGLDEVVIHCGPCEAATIPMASHDVALEALAQEKLALRPKALSLTLFARLFVADLFLHGVGGGKYDAVTDRIIEGLYGVAAPPYAVTSMSMYLPTGSGFEAGFERTEAVGKLQRLLNTLRHNPDRVLEEAGTPDVGAARLVRRKQELVDAISRTGADKKRLGAEIRQVNDELQAYVQPIVAETLGELEKARAAERSAQVARRRDYPFCFFSPSDLRRAFDVALGHGGKGGGGLGHGGKGGGGLGHGGKGETSGSPGALGRCASKPARGCRRLRFKAASRQA